MIRRLVLRMAARWAEVVEEDGVAFEEKMKELVATLREQMNEGARLDAEIVSAIVRLGYGH